MTVRRETFELLDGLRGLAAIAVVALHVGDAYGLPYGISHGYLAVPFFFTLSGIVIAHAYENGVMRTVPPLAFLAIRIERLYPLLVMGLILSVTLSVARAVLKGGDTSILETGALLLAAVTLVPVAGSTEFPLLPPQWSLAIEIWGNVAHRLLVARLTDRALAAITLAGGVAMAIGAAVFGGLNIGWSLGNLAGGLAIFGFCYPCGVLLYRLRSRAALPRVVVQLRWLVIGFVATLCLPVPLRTAASAVTDVAAAVALYPVLLVVAIDRKPAGATRAAARWLGQLSYPLYITHYPVILAATGLVQKLNASRMMQYASVPIVVLVALAVAALCLALDVAIRRRLPTTRGLRARTQPAAAP